MPRQGKKPKAPNRDAVPPGKSTGSGTSLRAVRGFRNNEKGPRNATSRASEHAHRMEPRCKERAAVHELVVCILPDKHPIPVCRSCSAATRISAIPCPVRHMCAGRIMRSDNRVMVPGRVIVLVMNAHKKRARCQPLAAGLGNPIRKLSCAPVGPAQNEQDITRTDNYYTRIKLPLARLPKFAARHKGCLPL